jgi:DNA polymerase eta
MVIVTGYEAGRSKQAPFPFTRDLTVDTIAHAGDKLWKELVGNTSTLNVTSVQLAFTGIDAAEAGQSTIEGFLKPASSKKRARDSPEVNIDSHHSGPGSDMAVNNSLSELSFICSRCGKKITVPTIEYPNGNQEDILMKAKMEHDDFHFAQDLAHDDQPQTTSSESKTKSKPMKKRKVPPEPKGIEKFFRK